MKGLFVNTDTLSRTLHHHKTIKMLAITLMLASSSGCSLLIGSASQDFGEHMRETIANHDDPATVSNALPSYLLTLETLLAGNEDDATLQLTTAKLYNAYVALLPEEDQERKTRLSQRALDFALQGVCLESSRLCDVQHSNPDELQTAIESSGTDDLESLYTLGTTWAGWIQQHKSDWNAIAQLAHVKAILQRILAIDDGYQHGNPHLYLGVLESLIPANLGGQPDVARQHFERAMQLAPENLMAPLLYAKHYARMQFDRELHDHLLKTVVKANPIAKDLTLINHLAQKQAQVLLNSANQYF